MKGGAKIKKFSYINGGAANKNSSEVARWLNDLVGFLFCVAPHCSGQFAEPCQTSNEPEAPPFLSLSNNNTWRSSFQHSSNLHRPLLYFLFPFFLPFPFRHSIIVHGALRIFRLAILRLYKEFVFLFSLDDETIEMFLEKFSINMEFFFFSSSKIRCRVNLMCSWRASDDFFFFIIGTVSKITFSSTRENVYF